ncbi:MAG: hypothetical protein ACRELG_21010 [Gemmataceae bacterium]
MIRFTCPTCKTVLQSPGPTAGNKVACPKCGQRLLVPNPVKPAAGNKTTLGAAPKAGGPLPFAPPRRNPRAARLALFLALGLCALLAAGRGVFALVKALTKAGDSVEPSAANSATERASKTKPIPAGHSAAALAKHPFWKRPLTAQQVEEIADRLAHPGRTGELIISNNGYARDRNEMINVKEGEDVFPISSHPQSREDALLVLKSMMDDIVQKENYRNKYDDPTNNLKQMTLALQNYNDTFGITPACKLLTKCTDQCSRNEAIGSINLCETYMPG